MPHPLPYQAPPQCRLRDRDGPWAEPSPFSSAQSRRAWRLDLHDRDVAAQPG